MAGQTITLQTPLTTADTAASVVSKINTDLSAIQVELARKVTPDDMLVTTDLSMVGHYITEAGGVILEDTGLSPSTLGTVYYSGGDLWVVTSGGAVQITDSGAINVASAGGITGDYPGASGASVDYTHSTLTYAFMDSPTAWSNLKGLGYYILNAGLTATTKLATNASTTGIWYFCNLPVTAAGVYHLVTVDANGTMRVNDTVDAEVSFTAGFTSAADQKHTDAWVYPLNFDDSQSANATLDRPAVAPSAPDILFGVFGTNPNWVVNVPIKGIRVGDKITALTLRVTKAGVGTVTLELKKWDIVAGTYVTVLTGNTSAVSGTVTVTATGTAVAVAATEQYVMKISGTTDLTSGCFGPTMTVTHP